MSNYELVMTPLAAHFKLLAMSCPTSAEKIEKMSHVPHSSAVGSLMYIMVSTRPDLAYVFSVESRCMHDPGKDH